MKFVIFLSFLILAGDTWEGGGSAIISSILMDSPDIFYKLKASVRGIRYKTKSIRGSTTIRPTWRPIKILPDRPKIETDGRVNKNMSSQEAFPDDYYDDYDGERDGTGRNILLHKTFEFRHRLYLLVKREQQSRNGSITNLNAQATTPPTILTTVTMPPERFLTNKGTSKHLSAIGTTRQPPQKDTGKPIGRLAIDKEETMGIRWSKKKGLLHRLF